MNENPAPAPAPGSRWKAPFLATFWLLLFFGLPFFGTLWAWQDAHGKIRGDAVRYAQEVVVPALESKDAALLTEETRVYAQKTFSREFYDQLLTSNGRLTAKEDLVASKSYTQEQDDMMWQYAEVDFPAQFESGPRRVHLKLSRKTMEPRWRIAEIRVKEGS